MWYIRTSAQIPPGASHTARCAFAKKKRKAGYIHPLYVNFDVSFCLRLDTKGMLSVLLILFTPHFCSSPDDNFLCFTKHEPVGVCGAIIPVSICDSYLFSRFGRVLSWQARSYLCMMEGNYK